MGTEIEFVEKGPKALLSSSPCAEMPVRDQYVQTGSKMWKTCPHPLSSRPLSLAQESHLPVHVPASSGSPLNRRLWFQRELEPERDVRNFSSISGTTVCRARAEVLVDMGDTPQT